jgi:hypothetical protein
MVKEKRQQNFLCIRCYLSQKGIELTEVIWYSKRVREADWGSIGFSGGSESKVGRRGTFSIKNLDPSHRDLDLFSKHASQDIL